MNGRDPLGDADGVVKRTEDVPLRPVAAGTSVQTQVLLGPDDGDAGFAMRRFVMDEGGGMPLHTNTVPHQQYVLRGRGRVTIGGTAHEVAAGSLLFIPAGAPHRYEVIEGPFEFLCVVPDRPDTLEIIGTC